MTKPARYAFCCVGLGIKSVRTLHEMIEQGREITMETFRRNVSHEDFKEFQRMHGYAIGSEKGLHLKDDFHVAYRKSHWKERTAYYLVWSAIKFIFLK